MNLSGRQRSILAHEETGGIPARDRFRGHKSSLQDAGFAQTNAMLSPQRERDVPGTPEISSRKRNRIVSLGARDEGRYRENKKQSKQGHARAVSLVDVNHRRELEAKKRNLVL